MKHLLSIEELERSQIHALIDHALLLKATRGNHEKPLTGKTWAMIFMKSSTRTRVSFDVAIQELGGHSMFLSSADTQLGRGDRLGY